MIHNTHYNLIDTLILAFGYDFWEELTWHLFSAKQSHDIISKYQKENKKIGVSTRLESHRHYSEKLANVVEWNLLEEWYEETNGKKLILPFPIKFTLCELYMWALTEAIISDDWGYGFKKRKE